MSTRHQITKQAYGLWVEVIPTINGTTSFQFQTTWEGANDPNELHNKFQMILSQDEIKRLIEILQNEMN